MNHTDAIKLMLENLDRWRHLPKYQLERRADVFFGPFIKQILAASGYAKMSELSDLFPEFPFRYDKKSPEIPNTFHTVNFDYVLFRKQNSQIHLNPIVIELKTDLSSAGESNNSYLSRALHTDFSHIVNGILSVAHKSTSKTKYQCLLAKMGKSGIIKKEGDEWVEQPALGKPQIIYLIPFDETQACDIKKIDTLKDKGFKIISFNQIAEIIDDNQKDSYEHIFAKYLRRWNAVKAGSIYNE